MKISVDGGGLGAKKGERFGNYVFSENLIKALCLYDKKNKYFFYTFENLKPRLAWLKGRVSLEEFKERKDIFLALNQAIPLFVSGKIVSFCHGLSYYFFPQYYSKQDRSRLNKQLKEMIKRSDYIIVSSERVKKELTSINRSIERKVVVIPFGIPFDMKEESRIENQESGTGKYFLYVGMDHPIKNLEFIKKLSKNYRVNFVTKNMERIKLKQLYRQATALLTASYYESFNLPVLEALSQGCPVIGLRSAIIPELRPYVNLAKNNTEFVDLMERIPVKPNVQSIKRLKTEFNWENYVEKLVELY